MELAAGEGGDFVAFGRRGAREADQAWCQGRAAVRVHDGAAELGLLAAAPGVDAALGVKGEHVVAACCEGSDVLERSEKSRCLLDFDVFGEADDTVGALSLLVE